MAALTFLVWAAMYVTRIGEMQRKKIDAQRLDNRVNAQALLTESSVVADNLKNLFEMPILFYVAILLALSLLIQDSLTVLLAWGFVGARFVHSLIHCSYNDVNHRFAAYAVSCVFLLLLWIRLATYILMN